MNTAVCPPGPPVCTTLRPGTVLERVGHGSDLFALKSPAVITVTELATWFAGVGTVVALTTICGSVTVLS